MRSGLEIALLVLVPAALADEWAHRDELAARRFRELSPATVSGELDQSRNKRWHRVGFRQRLETTTLAAVLVFDITQSWLAFGLGALLMGAVVSLVFDISFNIRLRLPWYYAGTTAWLDEWLNRFGVAHKVEAGKVAAAFELVLIIASAAAWQVFI